MLYILASLLHVARLFKHANHQCSRSRSYLVVEQGLSLAISLGLSNAAEETVASVVFSAGYIERDHREDAENDECKDPLQGDDLDGELADGQS